MRALRYSSTLFPFNQERRLIKLMLLYYGLVLIQLLSLFYCFVLSLCQLSTKIHLYPFQQIFHQQAIATIDYTSDYESQQFSFSTIVYFKQTNCY